MALRVKFNKLSTHVSPPVKASDGSAGYDIYGYEPAHVETKDYGYIEYRTHFSLEIPPGYCGLIFPRLSISNTGLLLATSVVTINSDFRDEIKVRFKYIKGTHLYNHAERIGQLVFVKVSDVQFVTDAPSEEPESIKGDA